jgi:DNA modification methylase
MKDIESESIDLILTDPPYGTTACKWDSVIDLKLMWEQLKRIIKPIRFNKTLFDLIFKFKYLLLLMLF